jgi:hypothetical protein
LPAGAAPLADGEVGGRGCYMTILQEDRSFHYRVDPELDSILSLFEQPQRLQDVIALLRNIAGSTTVDDRLLDELVEIGALVSCRGGGHNLHDAAS